MAMSHAHSAVRRPDFRAAFRKELIKRALRGGAFGVSKYVRLLFVIACNTLEKIIKIATKTIYVAIATRNKNAEQSSSNGMRPGSTVIHYVV
jgi:hypothetical protein